MEDIMALSLRLPYRDPNKPRTTMRERFRCAAARIMPRSTAGHRKGGGVILHVDPVYSAIEEARSAWAAYAAACEIHGRIPYPECETSLTKQKQSNACEAFFKAWERVKAVRPTTLHGTAAYAAYLVEACEKLDEDEFAPRALKALAEGVQGLAQARGRSSALKDKAKALTAKILHFPETARPASAPDAELLQLVERYFDVRSQKIEQAAVCDEAETREWGLRPERPAALKIRRADWYDRVSIKHLSGWYDEDTVEELRIIPRTRRNFTGTRADWKELPDGSNGPLTDEEKAQWETVHARVPDPRAQARADAIVAAWDAWQAELERARIVSGAKAADELYLAISEQNDELLLRIINTPASSVAGAVAKARCAKTECTYLDGLEKQIAAQMEHDGGPNSEALCTAVVRDLLRIAGEQA
jgi:MoxR-like ATPase